jgi:hypothetical protein
MRSTRARRSGARRSRTRGGRGPATSAPGTGLALGVSLVGLRGVSRDHPAGRGTA